MKANETLRYRIDRERCTGCCDCLRVCADHAIHKVTSELCAKCPKYCMAMTNDVLQCMQSKMCIDTARCTACGKCFEVCEHGAIICEAVPDPQPAGGPAT